MGNNLDIFELPKIKNSDKCTACNTGFASGGLTCKLGAFCFYSSFSQVESFVLRNPPERKAAEALQASVRPYYSQHSRQNKQFRYNLTQTDPKGFKNFPTAHFKK